jgi:hypothetical protein
MAKAAIRLTTGATSSVACGGLKPSRVNVLLGILAPFFAFGAVLGALAYVADGIRHSGFRRRWDFVVALLLAGLAYGSFATMGEDFARASDLRLIGTPADASSLVAVVVWAGVSGVVFVAGVTAFVGALRSSGTPA